MRIAVATGRVGGRTACKMNFGDLGPFSETLIIRRTLSWNYF